MLHVESQKGGANCEPWRRDQGRSVRSSAVAVDAVAVGANLQTTCAIYLRFSRFAYKPPVVDERTLILRPSHMMQHSRLAMNPTSAVAEPLID